MNPLTGLLKSRAVLLALSDAVFSTILFFAAKYAGAASDDIKFMVSIYQPVVVLVIGKMGFEDVAKTQAQAKVTVATIAGGAQMQTAKTEAQAQVVVAREENE